MKEGKKGKGGPTRRWSNPREHEKRKANEESWRGKRKLAAETRKNKRGDSRCRESLIGEEKVDERRKGALQVSL